MSLWKNYYDGSIRCLLCPHNCIIKNGEKGICGVRENREGKIFLITYGLVSGYALDPVEKKPLYHFFPGSEILSAGSYGCNLKCDFCQNYHISQNIITERHMRKIQPGSLVHQAKTTAGNIGIAYTYNEPIVSFEYVTECARLAAGEGLKNVLVTNGYINPGPLNELIRVIDAFNIDLKGFNDEFYRRYTGATLKPVLEAIKTVADSGRHLEITTLIIPGLNDSPDEMAQEAAWIAEYAGRGVPLHISRYFPSYLRGTDATSPETITDLREIAAGYLDYVYTGNMAYHDRGGDTICPSCHSTVIRRSGYKIDMAGMTGEGACRNCGREIILEKYT